MPENLRAVSPEEFNIDELKRLASSQPKIGHLYSGSSVNSQYRDNFFKRFIEISAIRNEHPTDTQVNYVRMVKERFGLDLLAFYEERRQLCDAICDAIEAKAPYDMLVHGRKSLLQLEGAGDIPANTTHGLDGAANHPLGIEAIGIYYWEMINPLLEQAYTILDSQTLNAPFLSK